MEFLFKGIYFEIHFLVNTLMILVATESIFIVIYVNESNVELIFFFCVRQITVTSIVK